MTSTEADLIHHIFARNPRERARLMGKHVIFVGLGSVGSALAVMAARAGVNRLTLVDKDCLTPENIGRHLCDLRTLDLPKAHAVAALIRQINPTAQLDVRTADFGIVAEEIFNESLDPAQTVLVATTDSFACQSLINLHALRWGLPTLYVGCWGEARVGEILAVVPGRTACYECYAGFRRDTELLPPDDPRRYTELDVDTTRVPAQAGLWPNILVICGFAFQVLLALLGGKENTPEDTLDEEYPLWLVNVADFSSLLRPLAVTPAAVKRGCAVCDESYLSALTLEAV